jgi:hypothetical protein
MLWSHRNRPPKAAQSRRRFPTFPWAVVLAAALLNLGGQAGNQAALTIAEQGRARCTIVVGDSASQAVRFAAAELQRYLKRISGADIPIETAGKAPTGPCIFVGDSEPLKALKLPPAGLARDALEIKTASGHLILAGGDDSATQFAVYTFLEKYLGVRWLWPGELGEVVPRNRSVAVGPIDEIQKPDFTWRNRGPGGALWGAADGGPTEMRARERLLGVSAAHQAEVALWEKHNKWGGMKIYGGHALGEIFPPEKYAKSHPEYYALVGGKRAVPGRDYDYKHGGQVCTTNPEVVEVAIQWVRRFFDARPDYDGVHITMNDGGGFCECERCRALDSGELVRRAGIDAEETKTNAARNTVITDRIFTFVNQAAEGAQKTHPGKYVVSLAYSRYITPPRNVRLHPSVIAQYCLWGAYRHASPAWKQEHEQVAAGWAQAGGRAGVYEYFINGSWPGLHRLVTPYISESIKYLKRTGFDLYQTQAGDDFAINGINYYVAGKLLWDTSLDERAILDDFYEKGFGRAAPAIQRYHRRLEQAWTTATSSGNDVTCQSLRGTRLLELFTPELLQQCRLDLREAEKLADDALVRKRIEFFSQGLRYTELTVAAVEAARKLEAAGVPLFPREKAAEAYRPLRGRQDISKLLATALDAWQRRDNLVEQLKDDYVVAYFWVKYNEATRPFNPLPQRKELAGSHRFR